MPIDLCIWCNAPTMYFCKRCGKPYCDVKCRNRTGEDRNPEQPCQILNKSIARSKALAAAGY